VTLRRKVHYGVETMCFKQIKDKVGIGNVSAYKRIVGFRFDGLQIRKVSRVGQFVQVD
jgi:hypothetical protein